MSRCRTRGSNGDSQASISDLSSGAVVLKLFAMMVQLSLLLKACDIFHFHNSVERMLMKLGFVGEMAVVEGKRG